MAGMACFAVFLLSLLWFWVHGTVVLYFCWWWWWPEGYWREPWWHEPAVWVAVMFGWLGFFAFPFAVFLDEFNERSVLGLWVAGLAGLILAWVFRVKPRRYLP